MAFYPRKSGLATFRYAKAAKDTICFLCGEPIKKGDFRYANSPLSLCVNCADCWEKEGGMLGDISRANKESK